MVGQDHNTTTEWLKPDVGPEPERSLRSLLLQKRKKSNRGNRRVALEPRPCPRDKNPIRCERLLFPSLKRECQKVTVTNVCFTGRGLYRQCKHMDTHTPPTLTAHTQPSPKNNCVSTKLTVVIAWLLTRDSHVILTLRRLSHFELFNLFLETFVHATSLFGILLFILLWHHLSACWTPKIHKNKNQIWRKFSPSQFWHVWVLHWSYHIYSAGE